MYLVSYGVPPGSIVNDNCGAFGRVFAQPLGVLSGKTNATVGDVFAKATVIVEDPLSMFLVSKNAMKIVALTNQNGVVATPVVTRDIAMSRSVRPFAGQIGEPPFFCVAGGAEHDSDELPFAVD